jgi:hypothetical protein
MLDEGVLGHEGLEGLARGEVVLDAVGLAGAGEAGRVFCVRVGWLVSVYV